MTECNHMWRIKVELFLDISVAQFHSLSKEALRSKDVRIEGANWPKAYAYCARCGVQCRGLGGAHP